MAAGADLVERGQVGDAPQVSDAAGVDHCAANVVDQLLLDQLLAVPDGVEHFAHGQRSRGVAADMAEGFLVLRRRRVLHPEQAVGLQRLAKLRRLVGRQPVVHVVQQLVLEAVSVAQLLEQLRREIEVLRRVPHRFGGKPRVGRLVMQVSAADAVGLVDTGNAALRADRLVAHIDVTADRIDRLLEVGPVGVAVDQHPVAAAPAEQLVERHAGHLALDVPQRGVDSGDRAHRYRPAPPVGAAVEVLPDILDPLRVLADQAGDHVVGQVGGDRQFTPVERRVADPGDTLVGLDQQRHEIAARACDDDPCRSDFHARNSSPVSATIALGCRETQAHGGMR